MQLQEGVLFDERYRLKKLLGRGAFSDVWLAEDTKVGNEKRALKIYAPGKGLDDDGVHLFSREFQLVYDLNHNHLLRPSHFDVCDYSPFLVLPFCERGSAAKLIAKITEEEAWHFLHDVASGLAFLHEQELPIIHQDIKPDNVLIDQKCNYLITDFGISAKARNTLRKSIGNVKSGGTRAYMAPERFGKENIPIKASDIWSLGATLFELITGDVPFGEAGGVIQKSGAEIPNLTGVWSPELKKIVTLCLQLETWDRPIAVQLVDWAEKHFRGENVFVEERPTKPPNKKKSLWIVGCVVFLLLSIIIVFYLAGDNNSNPDSKNTDSTFVQNYKSDGDAMVKARNFSAAAAMYEQCMKTDSDCIFRYAGLLIADKFEGKLSDELYMYVNQLVQKGNLDAMAVLGYLYENGLGVTKNIEESDKWYTKAGREYQSEVVYNTPKNEKYSKEEIEKWKERNKSVIWNKTTDEYKRGYSVSDIMIQNDRELVYLILNAKSLDEAGRKEWFDLYARMNEEQIQKLYDILMREGQQLLVIEQKAIGKKKIIELKYFVIGIESGESGTR